MSEAAVHEAIKKTIDANDVVLFMKGTAKFPQCGFSAQSPRSSITWECPTRT